MSGRTRRPGGGPRPSAAGRYRPAPTPEVATEPVLQLAAAIQPPQLQNREVAPDEVLETTLIDEAPLDELPVAEPVLQPAAAIQPPQLQNREPAVDETPVDETEAFPVVEDHSVPPRRSAAKGTRVLHAARAVAHTAASKPIKAASTWNADMLEKAESGPRCGTRWGRGAVTLVPSVALTVGIGGAIAQGVLAASLNLTNQPFTLYSNKIAGTGMGLYLNSANTAGGGTASARVGIASATLDGFCGLVKQPMSLAGINKDVYMIITAGQSVTGTPNTSPTRLINASNLFMQASSLTAGNDANNPATIQNAILGISADNIQMPTGTNGAGVTMPTSSGYGSGATPGGFGLQGSGLDANGNVVPGTITIPGLKASAVDAEIAGNLALPNLNINIAVQSSGSTPPACPSTGY